MADPILIETRTPEIKEANPSTAELNISGSFTQATVTIPPWTTMGDGDKVDLLLDGNIIDTQFIKRESDTVLTLNPFIVLKARLTPGSHSFRYRLIQKIQIPLDNPDVFFSNSRCFFVTDGTTGPTQACTVSTLESGPSNTAVADGTAVQDVIATLKDSNGALCANQIVAFKLSVTSIRTNLIFNGKIAKLFNVLTDEDGKAKIAATHNLPPATIEVTAEIFGKPATRKPIQLSFIKPPAPVVDILIEQIAIGKIRRDSVINATTFRVTVKKNGFIAGNVPVTLSVSPRQSSDNSPPTAGIFSVKSQIFDANVVTVNTIAGEPLVVEIFGINTVSNTGIQATLYVSIDGKPHSGNFNSSVFIPFN